MRRKYKENGRAGERLMRFRHDRFVSSFNFRSCYYLYSLQDWKLVFILSVITA